MISESFDYIQTRGFLTTFFWRYSHLAPRRQECDPTISKPLDDEVTAAKAAFKDALSAEFMTGFDSNPEAYTEFLKVMVPDYEDPAVEKPFLIPLPLPYQCRSPFARATRPTLAYDLTDRRIVFLKDYWRPEANSKEGRIYSILHRKNVSSIPQFGTGNDVRDHATLTHEIAKESWVCHRAPGEEEPMIPCLKQYRITLLVVGRPLTKFRSTKEFVSAVADAMEAHDVAYFQANILHRDISVGNILITEKGGLLIDWDMCVKVNSTTKTARRPKRTGTWQFMSARLLQNPGAAHRIEDDRESALYVLLWTALRYHDRLDNGDADDADELEGQVDADEEEDQSVAVQQENQSAAVEEVLAVQHNMDGLGDSDSEDQGDAGRQAHHFDFETDEDEDQTDAAKEDVDGEKPSVRQTAANLIRAFDEAYADAEGEIKGGFAKSSFLGIGVNVINFKGLPQFNALIEELRASYAFRYSSQPRPNPLRKPNPRWDTYAQLQKECRKVLKSEGWLVKTMRSYLEEEDGWLSDDAATAQDTVIQTSTSHKRKLDQARVDKLQGREKRSRPGTV